MRSTYLNKVEELERIAEDVQAFGYIHGLEPVFLYNLNLCIDEVFTNIIYHGFDDATQHEIEIQIDKESTAVIATVIDNGKPFNPLIEAQTPDITTPLEKRKEGGLGLYFLKKLMDHVDYVRKDNKNILTMRKALAKPVAK